MGVATAIDTGDIAEEMDQLGRRARAAVGDIAQATTDRKNTTLFEAAAALRARVIATAAVGAQLVGALKAQLQLQDEGGRQRAAQLIEQLGKQPAAE